MKRYNKKKILIGVVCAVIIAGILSLAFIWNKLGKINTDSLNAKDLSTNRLSNISLEKMSGYQTIVLAGVDSRTGDFSGTNSDTMMIASIDHDNKKLN